MNQLPHQRKEGGKPRASFGARVRDVLRQRVPESRQFDAFWHADVNLGWVRWVREDGRFVYVSIRRRSGGWLTGEVGVSAEAVPLEELPAVTALKDLPEAGGRIALGWLLDGHERWWTTGGNEDGFQHRLDWLAQNLRLRLHAVLTATTRAA